MIFPELQGSRIFLFAVAEKKMQCRVLTKAHHVGAVKGMRHVLLFTLPSAWCIDL